MRERVDYRDQLMLLSERFPDKVSLSVNEVATILGIDRRIVKAIIEKRGNPLKAIDVSRGSTNKIYIIPLTALARYTAGGKK